MKILSWNVNGIRAVQKKGFVAWLGGSGADIVCLQETKAHPEQLDEELKNPDGYYSCFCSAERKGYSGVALYAKQEPQAVEYGFGDGAYDVEGRVIAAHYPEFILYNVYFPNGRASSERLAYKLAFYDDFLAHLLKQINSGKHVLVCGDFNTAHKEIDLARPKENSKISGFLAVERAWMDKLVENGFVDTLRLFRPEGGLYTWWDLRTGARARNSGWRLDYFFANEGLSKRVKDAFILPEVTGSDHCPVGIELDCVYGV